MYRFASSLIASAALVFFGMTALGSAIKPSPEPKIIATVYAHAHHSRTAWLPTEPHGL